jgi:hypothetical protein
MARALARPRPVRAGQTSRNSTRCRQALLRRKTSVICCPCFCRSRRWDAMKVFNDNNSDGATIQRADEDFFAISGRQYRVRHPHQTEIDLLAQQGVKMRNPWPVAVVKRLSATKHEVIVLSMTDEVYNPSSGDPVPTLSRSPERVVKSMFDLDEAASAIAASSPGGMPY